MDIHHIFEKSEALYLDIVRDISGMAGAVAEAMHKNGKDFDPEITVAKFDLLLQYSLLQAACSDEELCKNELEFIKDLTQYADFCDFAAAADKKYDAMTWESLLKYDMKKIKALLKDTERAVRAVSEEVISVFTAAEKADKKDHFSALYDNVFGIVSGLAFADGDEDSEDLKKDILIFDCLDRIEDQLK
ncbi:MAG: hypothetical protein II135_10055 [Clostridia bacterium]|nr:hypothetical protein [Clostridia bacterium]